MRPSLLITLNHAMLSFRYRARTLYEKIQFCSKISNFNQNQSQNQSHKSSNEATVFTVVYEATKLQVASFNFKC